jgi:hypothetical protein
MLALNTNDDAHERGRELRRQPLGECTRETCHGKRRAVRIVRLVADPLDAPRLTYSASAVKR